MLQSGPEIGKIWGFCPLFVLGTLQGKSYSKGYVETRVTPCGKVSKMSVKNVEKSGSGKINK